VSSLGFLTIEREVEGVKAWESKVTYLNNAECSRLIQLNASAKDHGWDVQKLQLQLKQLAHNGNG
jgi:hypothetical protein